MFHFFCSYAHVLLVVPVASAIVVRPPPFLALAQVNPCMTQTNHFLAPAALSLHTKLPPIKSCSEMRKDGTHAACGAGGSAGHWRSMRLAASTQCCSWHRTGARRVAAPYALQFTPQFPYAHTFYIFSTTYQPDVDGDSKLAWCRLNL